MNSSQFAMSGHLIILVNSWTQVTNIPSSWQGFPSSCGFVFVFNRSTLWFWYLFCHRRVASLWVLRCWGWCIDSMRGTWSGRMLSPQSKKNPHSLTTSILVINFIVVCCCRSQHWRQKFVDLALIWMEVFAKQISKWVVTAVAQDQVCQFEIHTCM